MVFWYPDISPQMGVSYAQKNLLSGEHLNDEKAAYEHLAKIRWPEGPVCVHCQSKKVYTLNVAGIKARGVEVWHLS